MEQLRRLHNAEDPPPPGDPPSPLAQFLAGPTVVEPAGTPHFWRESNSGPENRWDYELSEGGRAGDRGDERRAAGRMRPHAAGGPCKSDQAHCVLEVREGPPAWYGQEEAAAQAAAGRWTLFDSPLNPPRSCTAEPGGELAAQPMVIFADDRLLDVADRVPRPHLWQGEYLIWRRFQGHATSLQAACAAAPAVEALLDDWAAGLLKRFDAMVCTRPDRQYMVRIADFALAAARSRPRRWSAYLHHGMVQEPDRVRRGFDAFVQREFPGVTWEAFVRELEGLRDVLRVQLPAAPPPVAASAPTGAAPKLHGIAAIPPDLAYQGNGR